MQQQLERPLAKVLCIDDDVDILAIARVALEVLGGLTIATCSSGHEGVGRAEAWRPDLILLDVMMPQLDGPSTLGLLQKSLSAASRTPVVFMTARVERSEIDEYLNLGAVAVISKPFDPVTLASDLQTIWRRINSESLDAASPNM